MSSKVGSIQLSGFILFNRNKKEREMTEATRWLVKNYFFYIGILVVVILLNPDKITDLSFKGAVHIVLQSVFLFGIYAFVDKYLYIKVIFTFFIIFSLGSILTYNSFPSAGIIMSIFNTSINEACDFIQFNFKYLFLVLLIFIWLVTFPIPKNRNLNNSFIVIGFLYLIVPTLLFANSKQQVPENYIKSGLARGMSKLETRLEYIYSVEIANRFPPLKALKGVANTIRFIKTSNKDTSSSWSDVKSGTNSPALLIIGLGESLRADHLGIYGYKRKTTPLLQAMKDEGDLYIYKHAYSGGPNTWTSVPSMFTKFGVHPELSKSIINLAKDAGYETYWLSNQTKANEWDFSVSAIALQANNIYFSTNEDIKSIKYDDVLISKLFDVLKSRKPEEKTLIVLHFYGSHMSFNDRYPSKYTKYSEGRSKLEKDIDQYDNSILYTDYVLANIFKISKQYKGRFVYFSDHGLGRSDGDIPLKHDAREIPDISSLHVPLISNYDLNLNSDHPINLFYFECIFSKWSGISAKELTMDYCNKAQNINDVIFYDAHLNLEKIRIPKHTFK